MIQLVDGTFSSSPHTVPQFCFFYTFFSYYHFVIVALYMNVINVGVHIERWVWQHKIYTVNCYYHLIYFRLILWKFFFFLVTRTHRNTLFENVVIFFLGWSFFCGIKKAKYQKHLKWFGSCYSDSLVLCVSLVSSVN